MICDACSNRKDAKSAEVDRGVFERLAAEIVDGALAVHRELGPGSLESAYQICLAHELHSRGLKVECEIASPVEYRGTLIDVGYRIDMLVENLIVVENKTVETTLPIHTAEVLTYMKMSGCRLGFLLNWNVRLMKDGITRLVNNL